ncbi:hypothetical protein ACFVIM_02685 [Streptomyces sp. NPDC057638]|uniref:hypothetical protein n=1 Tax=Streptomyces sp. NPDC057638 TaxID=3346190 RepID=UPI003699DAC1
MTTIDDFHHDIPAESDFGYSQATRSGTLTHISGQLALDATGTFLHPVSAVLGVTELTFPDQLIEISLIADTALPA